LRPRPPGAASKEVRQAAGPFLQVVMVDGFGALESTKCITGGQSPDGRP
jgi:hypothetical protein